jgi:hypothetical protein
MINSDNPLKSISELKAALLKVNQYPNSHGFNDDELKKIIDFKNKLEEFNSFLNESYFYKVTQSFKNLKIAFDIFNERHKHFSEFTKYGWYVSPNIFRELDIEEYSYTIDSLNLKKEIEISNLLSSNFERNKILIFDEIIEFLPNRKDIVSEIYKAYESEYYFACINLCYAQTDGISNEFFNYGFFDTEDKELKIKSYVFNQSLSSYIASQLKQDRNEITRYVKKEVDDKSFDAGSYNRHLVLHGHSLRYGTKLNAVRAVLLLDFVCFLAKENFTRED